jgi:hypothetical protein
MTTLGVRLRAATKSENKKLRDFYLATETDTLPPPSLSDDLEGALCRVSADRRELRGRLHFGHRWIL